MKKIFAASALFCAVTAFGSGFQVLEQGASNIGTALAGSTANANNDASAAFWNPSAAIFSGLAVGETQMDSSFTFMIPSFEFTDHGSTNPYLDGSPKHGGNGGNAGRLSYIPNFYAMHRFDEEFALTLSMTSPYGLETDYDRDWVGRFHGINSDVMTLDINPSIVYRPLDWLSFSVGASAQWIHAELTQASMLYGQEIRTSARGSSWSGGANVGMTINYMEGGRFGVAWRSEVSHTLTGNMHLDSSPMDNILFPISADITMPQTVNVGVYQRLWGVLHRFAVMADYAWTGWSCFDELALKNSATGGPAGEPTTENWKDTSRVAVGFHYYPMFSENVVFRWGAAWDESPIRGSEYRTPRIPCSDRIWLSTGIGYKYKNMNFNLGYTYILFYNDSDINSTNMSGTVKGQYTGHAHLVSIQAGIRF